jgi:glycosyltransferase involved in cell wall biosynthesis
LNLKTSPNLKIGIVTSFMPPHLGGLEVIAETLFNAYQKAGYEVRWVSSRVPPQSPSQENGRIRVGCWNWLEDHLGVPWPVWGPVGIRKVGELVRWADVLHLHDCLYLASILGVALGRRLRKPIILTQHISLVHYPWNIINGIEKFAYRFIGEKVLRGATAIVLATPAAQDLVSDLLKGVPASVKKIPYGIDTERFRPATMAERKETRKMLGVPEAAAVVLLVGRLVEKKGVDLFYEVSRRLPECHFLLVGNGPLPPPKLANLTWVPFLPHEKMQMAYQAAQVFLLPSHGEGFPVAVHEAMATGLPVIVSRGEPFGRLLEQERAGIVVERTAPSLSRAVMELLADGKLAVSLGKRARKLVLREWSLESMAKRYIDLINELII